jgi:hypothetical protein
VSTPEPRLWIEPGGGFVQNQESWPADESASDDKAPGHSPGEFPNPVLPLGVKLHEPEQFVPACPGLVSPEAVKTPVQNKVLLHGQFRVQVIIVGDDTQLPLDPDSMGVSRLPKDRQGAARNVTLAADHPDRAGLAGPVWPQKRETLTLLHGKVEPPHGLEITVALPQLMCCDNRGHRRLP